MIRTLYAALAIFLSGGQAGAGGLPYPWPNRDEAAPVGREVPTLNQSVVTNTSQPSCEPGWHLVLDAPWGPKCARELKEPIYK